MLHHLQLRRLLVRGGLCCEKIHMPGSVTNQMLGEVEVNGFVVGTDDQLSSAFDAKVGPVGRLGPA